MTIRIHKRFAPTIDFRHLVIALAASLCAAHASAAEPDCKPQTQLDVAKIDSQIVLIGEAHGTNEIPTFTAGFVCSLLRAGKSVILAVEHDGDEQEALNRYLKSSGSPTDRLALLQGRTWKTYSDGRGSAAMFDLIESMRNLRAAGQRIGVLAFRRNHNLDVPKEEADRVRLTPDDNALQNRLSDHDMANNILYAAILYRRYVVVVLAGYSHTSTILASSDNPYFGTYMPMGQIASGQMPVFVIGIDTDGGEHWSAGADGGKARSINRGPLFVSGTRIDALVHIERLGASPPAVVQMGK